MRTCALDRAPVVLLRTESTSAFAGCRGGLHAGKMHEPVRPANFAFKAQ